MTAAAKHTPGPGIALAPCASAYCASGYEVRHDGVLLGRVERRFRGDGGGWSFRDDRRGMYGTVSTRANAIAALMEVSP